MAYVKIIPIRKRLDICINYVLNNEKTALKSALNYILDKEKTKNNHVIYESAINCRKDKAFTDIMDTKRAFSKTGGVLGYHIIHSYKPDEVTPELAHKVGMEFAEECFGDKYEAVIATHIDKGHIHNHITINSVSFVDGKKYRNNFKDYFHDMRGVSNRICSKYGLSVITPQEEKKSITYIEWLSKTKGKSSWSKMLKDDIDDAIDKCFGYGNFLMLMKFKGYEYKQGKYLAFKAMGKERFSRTYKLGDDYNEQAIKNRIDGKDLTSPPIINRHAYTKFDNRYSKVKITGFKALCYHYMYLLGTIKTNQAPKSVSLILKEDLIRFDEMTSVYNFIHDRNLNTDEDIQNYKSECEQTISLLMNDKQIHKNSMNKNRIKYTALTTYNRYQKVHELYQNGFISMKDESEKYLKAKQVLLDEGYTTEESMHGLMQEYSSCLEKASKADKDVRYFKKEMRMCDKAVSFSKHVEKRFEELNKKDQKQKGDKNNELRW